MLKFTKYPILLLFLMLLAVLSTLNYSGFCISKGRWLSDEEQINIVANYQNSRTTMPIYEKGNGYKNIKQVSYENVDELLAKNPGCCKIVGSGDVPTVTFWDRVFGRNSKKIIHLQYKIMRLNENGQQDFHEVSLYNTVSNCGENIN